MPAALAMSVRRQIVTRRQGGEKLASIARDLRISPGTVRNIWRQYQMEGQLAPHYERCRSTSVKSDAALYEAAVQLKQTHPGWGAGLIRVELATAYDEAHLPSERTLQRWFRRAGVAVKSGDTRPRATVRRGKVAHEVWAIDAKEQMQLRDGSYASWLTVTDEASGAILSATLFPHTPLEPARSAAGQAGAPDHDVPLGATGADAHG